MLKAKTETPSSDPAPLVPEIQNHPRRKAGGAVRAATAALSVVGASAALPATKRVFLMLQGPHGPFFDRVGLLLRATGAQVWRVGFNAGDEFFWSDKPRFIRHASGPEDWPEHLEQIISEKGVTDIVLYGDVRPIHAVAREAAQRHDLVLHVFEEGYLRPFWITYERGGSNGHSALMRIPVREMRNALRNRMNEMNRPPARWGDMRQHKFYGALYHFLVLAANRRYPGYRTHRQIGVFQEFRLNLRRFLLTPFDTLAQMRETRSVRRGGFPYVLVLMQLEHDSNFVAHSPYQRMSEFTDEVLTEFARSAPRHHHIVFKAHPLEDGRGGVRRAILDRARMLGIEERVHFVRGGKLARLLNQARAAVTVNSTAAQQALWRGLPVKAMGQAVFGKPGLVSDQSLAEFLSDPRPPHALSYRRYRDFLLESSQVPGGFYASHSRAHALRLVVDMMLAPEDPYQALFAGRGKYRQQMGVSDD
ncbi:capsule biosynthesis protein [Paracoccus sp. J56]|uniref:capsule biosynthesis protein n=1 Tax=Paracoccus sp. J56 TaxID=935850 RepID=UPI000A09CCC3|nr:capsule biosynthesis protein CapA [Paracoccus sp. J56]SMG16183.1 capsular polysaccharide export protein [Paracoccus sp. J56]